MNAAVKRKLQSMLVLSALTYRNYAKWMPGRLHDDRLRSVVKDGLRKLQPHCGDWRLAWGPESYRAPLSLFDDALMFVVRNATLANRYVVAVRGTNPISVFDWVLGDLWVSHPVPWSGQNGDAAEISMSTALGLCILQNMRSDDPKSGDSQIDAIWGSAGAFATKAGAAVSTVAKLAADAIGKAMPAPLSRLRPPAFAIPRDDGALIDCLTKAAAGSEILRLLDSVSGVFHIGLFEALEAAVKVGGKLDDGHDLLTFLKAASANGPIEITVTGHSKGGALAPALALWLAETLGDEATVDCVAFAGPSPGNDAFANRFNARFAGRFDRVVNQLDIVPRAWKPATLRQIGKLYDPRPKCPAALDTLVRGIANQVGRLGYANLGGRLTRLDPGVNPKLKLFAAQMIYQHLDGYFQALDLPDLTTADFFSPVE